MFARIGLDGEGYQLLTGLRLVPGADADRTDADHALARKLFEEVLQETEWALTHSDPPK
jgi:hypothetical protein